MKIQFYVINLEGSHERWKNASEALLKQNIPFQRFPAFDGRQLNPIDYPDYDENKMLHYMGRPIRGGEIGCYLSHLNCAKDFLNHDYDYAVVLEDDMMPSENLFNKIQETLIWLENQQKEWYLINIGALKRKIYTPLLNIQGHELSQAHYFPMTTTGIIWNRKGAEEFIKKALPIYAPVDNFFRDWLTKNNMGLSVYPPFVFARDGESDISGNHNRSIQGRLSHYGWLKQKRLWSDKLIALKNKLLGQ